ncbi:MAG TPA: potassium channel family protein, partial [Armatimonadota bacterium]|nr:potassium channel family protein [Armatimonadota bacterium]
MSLAGIAELLLGLALVALVLYDVFEAVVVPRWTSRFFRLSPFLTDNLWLLWRASGRRIRGADRREDFLGAYAPLALLLYLLVWVLLLILGYGLALYALRDQIRPHPVDLGEGCYLAGVSLFTLGFGDLAPTGALARTVTLAASASGLAVVALVLSLLFNLHAAFQRRETLVLTLDARGGAPPSGVTLLETYARYEMLDQLPAFFVA